MGSNQQDFNKQSFVPYTINRGETTSEWQVRDACGLQRR